jgi:preprotein translocase subunit YajC
MEHDLMTILGWAAATTAAPAEEAPSMKPLLYMFAAIFVLFYFLILRPQRTEQKKKQSMIDNLAKGDRVVSAGGIHGKVESINKEDNTVSVNVCPKISLTFSRSSINQVVSGRKSDKDS